LHGEQRLEETYGAFTELATYLEKNQKKEAIEFDTDGRCRDGLAASARTPSSSF
jgi:hypothetical protein